LCGISFAASSNFAELQKKASNDKLNRERSENEKKIEQLSKALDLTQQQKEKISAIMEQDSVKIEAERQKMLRILNDVVYKESGRKTRETLTPEQYTAYKTTFVKYEPNSPKGRKIVKNESTEENIDRMEKELGLSKEQKEKIIAIKKETQEASRVELDKFLALKRSMLLDQDDKIKENLTPEQALKYDVNKVEMSEKTSRKSIDVANKWMDNLSKELNLTAKQNEKILAIRKEFVDKSSEETNKTRKAEEAIITEEIQKIKALLTPEQAQKYELGQSARPRDRYKDAKEPPQQRVKKLADELMLTQEQIKQITVIMKDDSRKIAEEDDKLRVKEGVFNEQRESMIDDVLTPEQQNINKEKYRKESKGFISASSIRKEKASAEKQNRMEQLSKALSLTQQQKEKISAIMEEASVKIEAEWKNRDRNYFNVAYKEMEARLKEILTPEQYKIYADTATFVKYVTGESEQERIDRMEKALGLSKEQKEKIIDIKKEARRKGRVESDKSQAVRNDIRKDEDQKIKQRLTPEQLQKYDAAKKELREKSLREYTSYMKKWEDNLAKDLNLTTEDKEKVLAIRKEYTDRIAEETKITRKAEEAIMTEETQKVKAALTPEQEKKYESGQPARLKNWYFEMKKPPEQRVKTLADELMLTQEQIDKITVIMKDDSKKIDDEEDRFSQVKNVLYEQRYNKLNAVLTPEQQKKNKENLLKYKNESKEPEPSQ
jgi:Spy/CpxP family protein refolding chaperone